MKEKVWSLSGDTFHIKDENNVEVVQCRGSTFSLHDRKEFVSPNGEKLFDLRTKLLVIHKTFCAEAPDGTELFEVKEKFSSKFGRKLLYSGGELETNWGIVGTSKMIATFINASNQAPIELLIKGDWLDRSATITMGGIVVAQISRSVFNMREMLGGQQTVSLIYVLLCLGDRGLRKIWRQRVWENQWLCHFVLPDKCPLVHRACLGDIYLG